MSSSAKILITHIVDEIAADAIYSFNFTAFEEELIDCICETIIKSIDKNDSLNNAIKTINYVMEENYLNCDFNTWEPYLSFVHFEIMNRLKTTSV